MPFTRLTACRAGLYRDDMKPEKIPQQPRLTSPTVRLGGRDVINIDGYVPYFFASINKPRPARSERERDRCYEASETDPRRRIWWLGEAGYAHHDRILQQALLREAVLLRGVDPADLEIALRVMRRMNENVRDLAGGDVSN